MKHLKFRAWDKKRKEWYGASYPSRPTFYDFHIFGEGTLLCTPSIKDLQHLIITQFTGLKDCTGKDIYEGDIVYIAGVGDMEVTFPFLELYKDTSEWSALGEVKGNIFESKKL